MNGDLVEQKFSIEKEWTSDYIGFLIGCSFSFESALCNNKLPPRNVVEGTGVSVYKTTRFLDPAGIFVDCTYVVSMRPYKSKDIDRVRKVCSPFKRFHGEPIAWGFDDAYEKLGIKDLTKPDFGEVTLIKDDEIPVFWGCGVTPQIAAQVCKGKVMAHTPGHMLVLDLKDEEAVLL